MSRPYCAPVRSGSSGQLGVAFKRERESTTLEWCELHTFCVGSREGPVA